MNTVVRKIGNSDGVILPKEALELYGLETGDRLDVIATADGIRLVKSDADFALQMKAAREFMDKYRDVLAKLAK